MRVAVVVSCLALAAATASAVPAALPDGTTSYRAGIPASPCFAALGLGGVDVESPGEPEGDGEDERDDDERVPEGVLRATSHVSDACSLRPNPSRAPSAGPNAGRDPMNELTRPPRA